MKGDFLMKKDYDFLLIDVIMFEKKDVITASTTTVVPSTNAANNGENPGGDASGDGTWVDWIA